MPCGAVGAVIPNPRALSRKICFSAARKSRLEVKEICPETRASVQETLWEWFHRHEFLNALKKSVRPVLVIDQFEEVFTLGREKAEKECWFDELTDLCSNSVPEVIANAMSDTNGELGFQTECQSWRMVLCLREDFLARLEDRTVEYPIFRQGRIAISPLGKDKAVEAVVKEGNGIVDRSVAESIVKYVGGGSGRIETPLLSLFCSRLDILRHRAGLPKISQELVESNKDKILNNFYDESMNVISPCSRDYLEMNLLNENGYRTPIQIDDAERNGVGRAEWKTLEDDRILHVIIRDNVQWLEFSHDILAPIARAARERRKVNREKNAMRAKLNRQRKRAAVGIGLAILFSAMAFAMFILKARADKHRKLADEHANEARLQAEMSAANANEARRQADSAIRSAKALERERMLAARSLDFMIGMFRLSDPLNVGQYNVRMIDVLREGMPDIAQLEPWELRADVGCHVGELFYNVGLFNEATNLLFSAVALNLNNRPRSLETAHALYCASWCFRDMRDGKSALLYAQKALNIYESNPMRDPLKIALVCNAIGVFYMDLEKDLIKSREYLGRAFEIRKSELGDNHIDVAIVYCNLGFLHMVENEFWPAATTFAKAVQIYQNNNKASHIGAARAWRGLGQAYMHLKEYQKAIDNFNHALDIEVSAGGNESERVMDLYREIGVAYCRLDNYSQALVPMNSALEIANKIAKRTGNQTVVKKSKAITRDIVYIENLLRNSQR